MSQDFPSNSGGDHTRELLRRIADGDQDARDQLFKLMYAELKRMAIHFMSRERKDHTLQPTALVNEAFLRLPSFDGNVKDRAHFMAVAANAMRHVLVDHARARLSQKRGGGNKEPLDENLAHNPWRPEDMMDLDRILTRLEVTHPRQARVVEMRYFGGLSEDEIAEVLKVSSRTVKRDWMFARTWLFGELNDLRGKRSEKDTKDDDEGPPEAFGRPVRVPSGPPLGGKPRAAAAAVGDVDKS
jgi:RNA polymerase sigma-70 factor, ECF subfamily